MDRLLKMAQIYLQCAEDIIEPELSPEDRIKQEIRQRMSFHDMIDVARAVKNYYHIIKSDPILFNEVAVFLTPILIQDPKLLTKNQPELVNAIFEEGMRSPSIDNDDLLHGIKTWGSFLNPSLIKEYERKLLTDLKNESNKEDGNDKPSEYYETLSSIAAILKDKEINKYFNVNLLERVLAANDPARLPAFDPKKQQFKINDILKMLKSRDNDIYRGLQLTYPLLLDIINKSTPQAQQLLRTVLWQSYGGAMFHGRTSKFMLDEAFQPINVDGDKMDVYGTISPASDVAWNQYSVEEQTEREKWKKTFSDYGIVPFIEF